MQSHLGQLHTEAGKIRGQLLARQLRLENKLSPIVEDAYGLTPEEKSLLGTAPPPRDPLRVLENMIGDDGESGE